MWNIDEWKIRLSAFLVFSFLLASILLNGFSSHSRYGCRNCGSNQNQGSVSAYIGTYEEPSEPSIEVNELKGLEKEEALKINDLHKAFLVMLFLPLVAYSSLQSPDWPERIIIACSMIPLSGYYFYRFFKSRACARTFHPVGISNLARRAGETS
ncbi:MAG: hypothetical protein FGF53_08695 [Candidatus Brockarchaeota archaeon]|nr:hypothetical protein [Candidatus Brockarchaeota archaeon]